MSLGEHYTSHMNPSELSEQLMQESAEYGSLTDQLIVILERKPAVWMEIRRGVASDTAAERAFSSTPDGLQETTLRLKIKKCEKSMSAIKSRLRVLEMEIRNQI